LIRWSEKSEDFLVGEDDFKNLRIHGTATDNFYYFYDTKQLRLVKQFVLDRKPQVDYICQVSLIKKAEKFSPRLAISVRDRAKKISEESVSAPTNVKANVSLDDCHENFWLLISFLQSLREVEIPRESFSLVSQEDAQIVTALRGRDTESIVSIIRQISVTPGVSLSERDINQLLRRREKLEDFNKRLEQRVANEAEWQDFFDQNKWIFGYGLNYHILKQEQAQPYYGGTSVDGSGGQRGDYLASTVGDINFTVLVEIKTPLTPLLQGTKEIRSGAWSLSKDLTDAISQIATNIATWERGATQPENRDKLEGRDVYTVQPKGIIVIGSLAEVASGRSKRETFQRFRKSIHGIDILTFDELYARAKFIIESSD